MRIFNFFRRRTIEREMSEESELHVDRTTDRLDARALLPDEVRRTSAQEPARLGALHEGHRRGLRWIESVAGDIRFALRYFTRKPLMAVTIVLVLSIGIGVHAAVFSLIQSVTMRPAPGVPRDDALVAIRGKERFDDETRWRPRAFSYPELRDFAAQRDIFASVAGWSRHTVALGAGDGEGRWAQAQFVTSDFFSTIGIRPILGADLPFDDPAANGPQLVAVISHALWTTAFGSSPGVVGAKIRVNDATVEIVGVAPPRFNGAVATGGSRTLWMPLSARAVINRTTPLAFASRDSAILETVARLRAAVTLRQANAAVGVVDARFTSQEPSTAGTARAADVVALKGDIGIYADREIAIMATVFEAIAILILLITGTNVSALVIGAAVPRRHEIAIRLSLGASRGRLIRQMLTESSMLALAAGALGLVLYWWIATMLAVRLPQEDIGPDLMTVAFTMCFALGTGILFGLSPAFHATRRGAADALKDSAASATLRSRLQRVFVVAQVALTQPLLVGLAVTMAILSRDSERRPNAHVPAQTISVAFNAADVIRVRSDREADLLRNSAASRALAARADAAMERVAALPGVVGFIRHNPGLQEMELTVAAEDRSELPSSSSPVHVQVETTSPGYFALLDIPIVHGRDFAATDTAAGDIPLVIGSGLARELWGSEGALGKRFDRETGASRTRERYVVVGVYDSRHGMTSESQRRVHAPMRASLFSSYLVRTAGPAESVISSVRSVIQAEFPRTPIQLVTLAERDRENRAEALRASGAAGGGGLLALVLASIGLYGVVALALGQRRREIGVRIALGARPREVVRMLFWSGLRLSLTGLMLGLPLSVIAMQVTVTELTLPDVNMLGVGAATALVVIAVASLATWLPARRAAAVDPMITLRTE